MQESSKNKILNYYYNLKSYGFKYCEPIELNDINNHLPNNINELNNMISNCLLCSLSKNSNKKEHGYGDINSKIMLLSTKSIFNDKNEIDMVQKMFKNIIGIDLKDIYFETILKCNSIDKENIESEIEICKDYIIKQIDLLKPKLIITLGDSYNYLLNDNINISKIRGNILKYKNINLIPMYHPNLLLRNPSLKKEALEDLNKIKLLMEKI